MSEPVVFFGVAPLLDGGLCVIDRTGALVDAEMMPVEFSDRRASRRINGRRLAELMVAMSRPFPAVAWHVTVGWYAPPPRMPRMDLWDAGRDAGIIEGVTLALGLPQGRYHMARASIVQRAILEFLPGIGSLSQPRREAQLARIVFPTINLMPPPTRTLRQGIATAAALAWYGLRRYTDPSAEIPARRARPDRSRGLNARIREVAG